MRQTYSVEYIAPGHIAWKSTEVKIPMQGVLLSEAHDHLNRLDSEFCHHCTLMIPLGANI